MTALINELADQPGADEALLILDDYHVIGSEPVHASLRFLLEHRPPGLHLVLASRSDPPLGLARLRGRGQLAELREAELRFTPGEAAELLQPMAAGPGAALPDAAIAALAARTEGWAAGLQLAALWPGGDPEVGCGHLGSKEKSRAYEDDAQPEQSGEPVTDVGEKHGISFLCLASRREHGSCHRPARWHPVAFSRREGQ